MEEYKYGQISVLFNEKPVPGKGPEFLSESAVAPAYRLHQGHPAYAPTPLLRLSATAAELGIREFFVKDESKRFGLNAFKGLGGLYALAWVICRALGLDIGEISFSDLKKPEHLDRIQRMVFVTATDGNHGRGVAWAAAQLGCEAHVYLPKGTRAVRASAIREVNPKAEVTILDVGYDDAVRYAAEMAEKNGWYLIQDTSWDGYEEIPGKIIQGYTTMVEEACREFDRLGIVPTHVFVQAGVGAMAGGVTGYLRNRYPENPPRIGVVEPEQMACIYRSAQIHDGAPHDVADPGDTIMAGLNCGEPCTLTWPILRDFADWYFKCPDGIAELGMRRLASPAGEDSPVISGESGAVTAGLVHYLAEDPSCSELKKRLGWNADSVVLCFSTEGDTDPENYRRIVFPSFSGYRYSLF